MATIILDDALINEVIAVSHNPNAQEAVVKILADYLREHKNEPAFFEQMRLADDCAFDELALLFERNKDSGRNIDL
ncbi:MAG: type II toxin-antitoxin system VapB family antitoxin [Methylomicrobium sp.]|nr:type II toxin-antitoxin system VapB family antitoxin [Methylomicrobium sp.]